MRVVLAAFVSIAQLVIVSISCMAQLNNEPVRAAWLTNVGSDVLASRTNIKNAVLVAKECGLNTLITVAWNRGYTQYTSHAMLTYFGCAIDPAFLGRDPLQELIEEAHQENIKVIAWFEFGFSSAYQDSGKHILSKYPHWASKDVHGIVLEENGFTWMNPFHPQVRNFIASLVLEVVKNYDVDGVQGDDRLPALPAKGGYDDYTVGLYGGEHNGRYPPANHLDSDWVEWRCKKLNDFAKELYREVKHLKPEVVVSYSPSIWPWSKQNYLQDWPVWLMEGYADIVMPQLYRYNLKAYQFILNETVEKVGRHQLRKVFPGILVSLADGYRIDEELLLKMIKANREAGIKGESFFYFEYLKTNTGFFKRNYIGH